MDIVCNYDVEPPIPIVVNEGTPGSPFLAASGSPGPGRNIAEGAVALVVKKVSPGGEAEPGLRGDVGERSIAIVVKEVAGWWRGGVLAARLLTARQFCSVDEKDVRPAIAIVVEDGDSGAGRFHDVLLGGGTSVRVGDGDPRVCGDIDKPGRRRVRRGSRIRALGERQLRCHGR